MDHNIQNFRLVLASGSPRRKQILEQIGAEFEIWPSKKEEVISKTEPREVCVELAEQKALDVASQIKTYNEEHPELTTPQDILVIGADTIVAVPAFEVDGNGATGPQAPFEDPNTAKFEILGKPKDEEGAKRMLRLMSGGKHYVLTGVCFVFISKDGRVGKTSFYEETEVHFAQMDEDEIESYVATGEPMDKAGAYGIQGACAKYVEKINGDYYNVMGMPISRIYHELKELGVKL